MLRTRPVVLKKVVTIPKFHDFVFTDAAARLPHLKPVALVIDVAYAETYPYPECKERAIEALIAILRHAPSLKSLELSSSASRRLLGYLDDARLSAAVGEIPSLRELTIGGRTQVTDFISAVRAPLTRLTLCFLSPVGLKDWSPTCLSATLSRFKDSLKSLSIEESGVRLERSSLGSPALSRFTQFHALRSLTLNHLVALPHLSILLELFPNLDGTVHLAGFANYRVPGAAQDVDGPERYNFFKSVREDNGKAQERRRWTRLERFICDVDTLFVLNLRCPIGLTIVHHCAADASSVVRRRCLVESLREHPPTHLNLQLAMWLGPDENALDGTIPPEAAATLTHLTLCVKYVYDNGPGPTAPDSHYVDTRWDNLWRDAILPVIEPLRALTHFRLVFHCDAQEAGDSLRPIKEEPLVEDLRPTSDGGRFDFTGVASVIADALLSLRYCFVTNSVCVLETRDGYAYTVGGQWRESRAWRVACAPATSSNSNSVDHPGPAAAVGTCGSSGRRELEELHDTVAETIMEREGLDLSEDEKASAVGRSSFGMVCANVVFADIQEAMQWDE
ncbi:hypothetical protein V8D89_000222 [Ganoderma adspersum]